MYAKIYRLAKYVVILQRFTKAMNNLELIRKPIEAEMQHYSALFNATLSHEHNLMGSALEYVRSRQGKRMRPILVLLTAKALGDINENTYTSAVVLEMLHTASLIHDDVVDESQERRGEKSLNKVFNNKSAILVGDYILSKTIQMASSMNSMEPIAVVGRLGAELAEGELLQLPSDLNPTLSEDTYMQVIKHKTASLFGVCCELGALSVGVDRQTVEEAKLFGETAGICFQIRDDIFDYFDDAKIGKPTGNDMREGKLSLPVLRALQNTQDQEIHALAAKVRAMKASKEDIDCLVTFTKEHGGIESAQETMMNYREKAMSYLIKCKDSDVRHSLELYLDYVVGREM